MLCLYVWCINQHPICICILVGSASKRGQNFKAECVMQQSLENRKSNGGQVLLSQNYDNQYPFTAAVMVENLAFNVYNRYTVSTLSILTNSKTNPPHSF
jgi:hypothetical protein